MEELDYSKLTIKSLRECITHWEKLIKDHAKLVQIMEEKVDSGRAYSPKVLKTIKRAIEVDYGMITFFQSEIEECVSELFRRDGNV